jgi:glutamyl-tRNA reductase
VKEWSRRRNGPLIARLTQDCDAKRQAIVRDLFQRLNGKLAPEDREAIEKAFHLLQNRFLHGPINAVHEAAPEGGALLDAMRKLFGLPE